MDLNVNSFVIFYKLLDSISDFTVSDFISEHRALHATLQFIRAYSVRKQIAVRAIRRIKDDAIVKDLDKFSIDKGVLMWMQWLKCIV